MADDERDVLVDAIRLQRLGGRPVAPRTTDASALDAASREPWTRRDRAQRSASVRSRTPHHVDTTGLGAQLKGIAISSHARQEPARQRARHATRRHGQPRESETGITFVVVDDGPGIRWGNSNGSSNDSPARRRPHRATGVPVSASAITQEVVVAHGGTITVAAGPAARFTVSFPLGGDGRGPRPLFGLVQGSGGGSGVDRSHASRPTPPRIAAAILGVSGPGPLARSSDLLAQSVRWRASARRYCPIGLGLVASAC